MDPKLSRLGQTIARAEQDELEAFDLEAERARFLLHALAAPQKGQQRLARVLWASLVAAALGLAALGLWPRPIGFEVAGKERRPGEWIAAPSHAPLALSFSEGSQLSLGANARARVVDNSERGARIVLERGKLSARVVHRDETRWRIDAGPFAIYVVGTQFDVAWEDEHFELKLREGAVRVVGPTLPEGRVVRAGEQLSLNLAPVPKLTRLPDRAQAHAPELVAPTQPALAAATSNWRTLAASGAYERAFLALELEGFSRVIERVGPADLKTVADLTRLSQHPDHARRALSALRARFPRAREAADAAFLLGRLAFDQRGDPTEAAHWFGSYLSTYADGAFRREASGRLIECYERLDDAQSATRSARDYLELYPQGPHAALARGVLVRLGDSELP